MVWLEIIVVLGAIFFGIRLGGIGIGLCGGLGLAILTLGFDLQIGSPPVDVILIIMTVVVAASALQAAGGMDYLVRVAGNFMRRNPKYINIIAPIITVDDHYGRNRVHCIFYPASDCRSRQRVRYPPRTLAGSVVASRGDIRFADQCRNGGDADHYGRQRYHFYSGHGGMSASFFVAAMVAAFIASRQGCELQDDEVYLERLQKD